MYTKGIFLVASLIGLSGCTQLPQLFKSVEEIANNDCVTIKVDKDAFESKLDLKINLDLSHKDKD